MHCIHHTSTDLSTFCVSVTAEVDSSSSLYSENKEGCLVKLANRNLKTIISYNCDNTECGVAGRSNNTM